MVAMLLFLLFVMGTASRAGADVVFHTLYTDLQTMPAADVGVMTVTLTPKLRYVPQLLHPRVKSALLLPFHASAPAPL